MSISHSAFCDESNYNTGTYRGIGVVSISEVDRPEVEGVLADLMRASNVKELKWKDLASAEDRDAAIAIGKYVVSLARAGRIRVDVLSWRAGIPSDLKTRRNATDTLEVMYYWALKTVLKNKWPGSAVWNVVVDQQSAVDWALMRKLIDPPTRPVYVARADEHIVVDDYERFAVSSFHQCNSKAEPLVQVADLFSGASCFSREHAKQHERWSRGQNEELLAGKDARDPTSRSRRARFAFMTSLQSHMKENGIEVHLWRNGFITLNPSVPLNFWHWKPVNAMRAPQTTLQTF